MKRKINYLVILILMLVPSVVYAETAQCCIDKTCECGKSQCVPNNPTDANAKNGLRSNDGTYYMTIDGQDYKAYCIDPGSAQGAGCDTTCRPLPNDSFGQAFRNLLATATGSASDQESLRILGILTGYTRATTKSKLVNLVNNVSQEIGGGITKNHAEYIRAYEALYGSSPSSSTTTPESTLPKEDETSQATKITFAAGSASNGQITIKVTSSKEIKKMLFQVEGGEIVSQSWNGKTGTVVVNDSDGDCNIGLSAYYNAANALLCQRNGTQQFIVDTSMDKNGNAVEPGTYVTELIGDDEGEPDDLSDMAVSTYSITAEDYKKVDPSYYENTCKGKNECEPVVEPAQNLRNCCEDGGYVDVTEPELNDLFCKDEALGVEFFKKRIGSDKYIKTNATFVDGDGTINGLAKKYCTVYCTQRAYIDIPAEPNTGKNGLYFELKKGDWGTASAYIKGTKRCRVRIDYDAWWKQYNEYIELEIKSYNDFMQNTAIYRYIDDSSDTDAEIYKVKNEDYFVECTTSSHSGTVSKCQNGTCRYCNLVKVPSITSTKDAGLAIPNKKELSYNYVRLSRDENYKYYLIEWDKTKKDVNYTAVVVDKSKTKKGTVATDDYKYYSIAPSRVDKKIKERNNVYNEFNDSQKGFTVQKIYSGDLCAEQEPDVEEPKWKCDMSTQEIEEEPNPPTDYSSSSETPWIEIKNRYKQKAETASNNFTSSTTDARDMEKALDACNSYFYNEPKNFIKDLSVGQDNGYDAKKNYQMNSTYSFDYTQIYLDPMGELREFVTDIPFGPAKGDKGCYYKFETAHSYEEYPGEASEDGRTDMFPSYYSTTKYSKSGLGLIETYDDFSILTGRGKLVVGDEDNQSYSVKEQTPTWYDNFLHQKVGELKEAVFTNDKRFNMDGLYKMECMWDETDSTLTTFVPNGSSNTLEQTENTTSHQLQYSIFLTTLEGSYDTNHHIGCIGENCVFDDVVANGEACATDGGSPKKSSEDVGESAMSCSIHIDYSITLTGICHPNDLTAQIPDCELFGNDYNLFEFKIADAKDVLPNLKSGSYDYADNWFDENGSKAKEQIENDGNNDKTYSPDHLTYSFVLTPKIMRDIKAYDKEATIDGGYTDFMLTCKCDDGACHNCTSSFLTELNNGTYGEVKPNETWGNSKKSLQAVRSSSEHIHWKGAE